MTHLVDTGGNDVVWDDIAHWYGQGIPSATIASNLNLDYRHHRNTQVKFMFGILGPSEIGVIAKYLGLDPDSGQDSFQWQGQFDQYHRQLPDAGTRNQLLRKGWNRYLTVGENSDGVIPCADPAPTHLVVADSREQRAGFVVKEHDEVAQELTTSTDYGGYQGELTGTDLEKHQAVHDAFVALTGGRRFGNVTELQIDDLIRSHEQEQAVADVTARANNAVNAARQSFAADNDPAQIIIDGDAAYNTPI